MFYIQISKHVMDNSRFHSRSGVITNDVMNCAFRKVRRIFSGQFQCKTKLVYRFQKPSPKFIPTFTEPQYILQALNMFMNIIYVTRYYLPVNKLLALKCKCIEPVWGGGG